MADTDLDQDRFADSLPESYRQRFPRDVIAAHARNAFMRGPHAAAGGVFPSTRKHTSGLCIAALDQAGLLSLITVEIVASGFDVVDAEAYTRRTADGTSEAMDLFWLRRQNLEQAAVPLSQEEAAQIGSAIAERIENQLDPALPTAPLSAPVQGQETRVRFIEDEVGALSVLEVETGDRSGLLLALSQALFSQRVQILQSAVRTRKGRVFDRFVVVELDGSPISPTRRLSIQVAVLGAIGFAEHASGSMET